MKPLDLSLWIQRNALQRYLLIHGPSSRIISVVILLVFIILQPVNPCSHARALDISSFFESTTYQVMPSKGKRSRKRATCEGHRTTVKRIVYEVNEQLDAPTVDVNLNDYKQAPTLHVSKFRQGISARQIGNPESLRRRNPVKCGRGAN